MFNVNNQPEQKNVNEPDDSTYNYLGESTSSLSRYIEVGQLRSQSINGQSDDTYSHINANTAECDIQNPKTDYEDTTYNHIGDIPTATKSKFHTAMDPTLDKVQMGSLKRKKLSQVGMTMPL